MDVTRARRLEKYWARMVTVGRKERQKPNPEESRKETGDMTATGLHGRRGVGQRVNLAGHSFVRAGRLLEVRQVCYRHC